jgi:hypothetical protein
MRLTDHGRDRLLVGLSHLLWMLLGFLVGAAVVDWFGIAGPCE